MNRVDDVLVTRIRLALAAVADPAKAEPMRAYMKSAMPFLGVTKPERTRALRPVLRAHPLTGPAVWRATVRALWDGAQVREHRYAAIALAQAPAYTSWAQRPDALDLYDHMIVTGAWWDLVDEVAIRSVGPLLRAHPHASRPVVTGWARDENLWRRRTAIICQVGAGQQLDRALLATTVLANAADRDFFIRKAIGWALRQYARVDPDWVGAFVAQHAADLSGLSRREATKHLRPEHLRSAGIGE